MDGACEDAAETAESCPMDYCYQVNTVCVLKRNQYIPECCGEPTCCLAGTGNTTNPVLAVKGTEHEAMSTHIAAALILAMMTIALYLVL